MQTAFAIHNDDDYRRALALVDELWEAEPGTPESCLLDVMASLVDAYERRQRALPPPDPLAVIAFKLRELGWSQRELGRRLDWGTGRVSEVLAGKRPLTLRMVRDLSRVLQLPVGLLTADACEDDRAFVWVRLSCEHADRLREQSASQLELDDLIRLLVEQRLARPGLTTSSALGSSSGSTSTVSSAAMTSPAGPSETPDWASLIPFPQRVA